MSNHVHTTRILSLSNDLPIIVLIVDEPERIAAFMPHLDELITEGLVIVDDVEVIKYVGRPAQPEFVAGIAVAGALGAPVRYLLDGFVQDRSDGVFPRARFVINVTGWFILGLLTGLPLDDVFPIGPEDRARYRLLRRVHHLLHLHLRDRPPRRRARLRAAPRTLFRASSSPHSRPRRASRSRHSDPMGRKGIIFAAVYGATVTGARVLPLVRFPDRVHRDHGRLRHRVSVSGRGGICSATGSREEAPSHRVSHRSGTTMNEADAPRRNPRLREAPRGGSHPSQPQRVRYRARQPAVRHRTRDGHRRAPGFLSTIGAQAAALGVIEGVADVALDIQGRWGVIADKPGVERKAVALGGYAITALGHGAFAIA